MVKIFTHTEEIEHCGQCPSVFGGGAPDSQKWWCEYMGEDRRIEDIWGKIPSWCPLPSKDDAR